MKLIVKTCPSCQRDFTERAWCLLPSVGAVTSEDETGTYHLEMRNCPCGSTIGIETQVRDAQAHIVGMGN
jgi:hypothetical protein